MMTPTARDLRIHIYDRLLERGRAPTCHEIATHFAISQTDARRSIAEMKIGKTVLPDPQTGEIWMAGPFSAEPTTYRVIGSRVQWFANCAWDMFGVAMIAREEVRIEAQCTDCGAPMSLRVDPQTAPIVQGVVHFLVPARRWYEDIRFT
jgi:hypothetical protein